LPTCREHEGAIRITRLPAEKTHRSLPVRFSFAPALYPFRIIRSSSYVPVCVNAPIQHLLFSKPEIISDGLASRIRFSRFQSKTTFFPENYGISGFMRPFFISCHLAK
jgi:hypothetical protein